MKKLIGLFMFAMILSTGMAPLSTRLVTWQRRAPRPFKGTC